MKKFFAILFILLGIIIPLVTGLKLFVGLPIAAASLILGIVLMFRKSSTNRSLSNVSSVETIQRLKQTGDRIEVMLEQCQISHRDAAGEALSGEGLIELFKSPTNSMAHYRTRYKDRELVFNSIVVPFERKQLMFEFIQQETTTIYIDPANPSLYYFDLEFLHKPAEA